MKNNVLLFVLACAALLGAPLLVSMCSPGAALAAARNFSQFSADVPGDWTHAEEDGVVSLCAPDRSCAVSVAVEHAQGGQVEGIAAALSHKLKGEKPLVDKGGFVFSFVSERGVRSVSRVTAQGERFVLVTVSGQCPALARVLPSLVLSEGAKAAPSLAPAVPKAP